MATYFPCASIHPNTDRYEIENLPFGLGRPVFNNLTQALDYLDAHPDCKDAYVHDTATGNTFYSRSKQPTTYDQETIPGVEITRGADYKGREYTGPYIVRVSHMADGPGYYIWQYSDDSRTLYRMAARPNVQPRKLKNWNCQVRRGWRTMAEAEAILQQILRPEKQPA